MRLEYYNCLALAISEATDDETLVRLTAEKCHQCGLPEEPCVLRTASQERISLDEDEIRKIFRTVYVRKPLQPRSSFNQKERIARGIADFFERRYQLRYNTVKKIEEWRPNDGCYHEWQQLTDRDLNRMTFEQMHEGGDGWGTHKTTFCRLILPPALHDYYIDDIKMDNAEQVERVLARMALVNIDEYNAKTEREQAKIKRILAEKDVQVRKMRSDQYVRSERTASFIATTNSPTPLTDSTGSRRYICCPVGGIIDTEPTVNYRQLYAQALFELRHGAAYYPSREEEQRMEAHNAQFQQMKKAELTLTEFFAPAERNKASLMTLSEVERSLHGRISAADMPSFRELSAALSQHFQPGAVDGRRGWYMRPKE